MAFEVFLPLCLATAYLFRYNILSFVYLIHLMFISTLPRAYKHNSASTDASWEKLITEFGIERVRGADAGNGIHVFVPDIGMFVVELAICCCLVQKRAHEDTAQYNAEFHLEELAWSIKYVSWLIFVFLIWSCSLCLERNLRCYAMLSLPFLVARDSMLIVPLYIWTFEDMGYIRVKGFFD